MTLRKAILSLTGLVLALLISPVSLAAASPNMTQVKAAYAAKDYSKTKSLLDEMIIHGDAEAMMTMGQLHVGGHGVEKSEVKAWNWTVRATDRFIVEKNYRAAIAVIQPYVQAGRVNAQIEQAVIAVKAGTPEQRSQAKAFILKLAESGNGQAQFEQAKIAYSAGSTKDEKWAARVKWLKLSAESGYAPGQNGYGAMWSYNIPAIGQKKDESKRFMWQLKAANQGDAASQYNVGNLFLNARGAERSTEKAAEYYEKAAQQGNISAMMAMGRAYASGIGVSKDKTKAVYWYKKVHLGAHHSNDDKYNAQRQLKKLGGTP